MICNNYMTGNSKSESIEQNISLVYYIRHPERQSGTPRLAVRLPVRALALWLFGHFLQLDGRGFDDVASQIHRPFGALVPSAAIFTWSYSPDRFYFEPRYKFPKAEHIDDDVQLQIPRVIEAICGHSGDLSDVFVTRLRHGHGQIAFRIQSLQCPNGFCNPDPRVQWEGGAVPRVNTPMFKLLHVRS